MPVIKPVFSAVASTPVATGGVIATTVNPVITRFFATITAGMIGATDTTVPAASFTDDADAPVVALPTITAEDSFNIYLNGVLQQSSLSTLTPADLSLDTIDLLVGTPVSIEVTNFTNTTSDLTTPPVISAPIITVTS